MWKGRDTAVHIYVGPAQAQELAAARAGAEG
jgi:hypothetical protein